MKIEIVSLTDLLMIIKKGVEESNIPQKQKVRTTKNIQSFATQAFNLGKNGKIEMEVSDDN